VRDVSAHSETAQTAASARSVVKMNPVILFGLFGGSVALVAFWLGYGVRSWIARRRSTKTIVLREPDQQGDYFLASAKPKAPVPDTKAPKPRRRDGNGRFTKA
jgi:hypothetical protein